MRYGGVVNCPFCGGGPLRTSDSRFTDGSFWCVARRRHCAKCKRSFQSYEILMENFQSLEKYATILQGLRELLEPMRTDLFTGPAPIPGDRESTTSGKEKK